MIQQGELQIVLIHVAHELQRRDNFKSLDDGLNLTEN